MPTIKGNLRRTLTGFLLFIMLFSVCPQLQELAIIHICFASDSHGNDINFIEVWQWNGTHYNLEANFTSTGGSVKVVDNKTIKFIVGIKFNNTLADSTSEARDYTKVLMNITDGGTIWNNEELNATGSVTDSGGFYWLKEEGVWNQTGKPEAGVTYEGSVLYQGYY